MSSDFIFATFQNAGIRVFNCDVFVDEEALVYSTDYNGGRYILECNI